jgi:hypothetical protein
MRLRTWVDVSKFAVGKLNRREGQSHTNVPSLSEDDSQEEDKQEDDGADPPVGCVGCQSIEGRLVLL